MGAADTGSAASSLFEAKGTQMSKRDMLYHELLYSDARPVLYNPSATKIPSTSSNPFGDSKKSNPFDKIIEVSKNPFLAAKKAFSKDNPFNKSTSNVAAPPGNPFGGGGGTASSNPFGGGPAQQSNPFGGGASAAHPSSNPFGGSSSRQQRTRSRLLD